MKLKGSLARAALKQYLVHEYKLYPHHSLILYADEHCSRAPIRLLNTNEAFLLVKVC